MFKSINEIISQPVVILLYRSGASGEFLGHALTSSIDKFTKTDSVWENNNRCKFNDYFGRTLTFGPVTEELILSRANSFLESVKSIGMRHLALSHLQPQQINFLDQYSHAWPVIEITTLDPISVRFQKLARNSKIGKEYQQNMQYQNIKINSTAQDIGFKPKLHLQIEWKEIILTNTKTSYLKITDFLDCSGNADQFLHLVEDYRIRNRALLEQADYES